MFQTIERYEHHGLGLPYPVVLINGAEEELDDNGERLSVHIPNQEGLAISVALSRALLPISLSGSEVRFIRRVLGMSAKDFGAALTIDHCTLSRWENEKTPPGQWADKQVRMAAVIALRDRVPGVHIDPQSVIAMKPRLRRDGEWPKFELKLLHNPGDAIDQHGNQEIEAWDPLPMAA